jgi:hypothetical protein
MSETHKETDREYISRLAKMFIGLLTDWSLSSNGTKFKMSKYVVFGKDTFRGRADVYHTVYDMILGYSGVELAPLQNQIIEYVDEELGKKVDRVTAYRWIKRVRS